MVVNSYETIVVERDRSVATIMFNRPERLNAFDSKLLNEVHAELDRIEADPEVRAVIVHGAGRAFSSGFDLKADASRGSLGVAGWRRVLRRDCEFLTRWWDLSKPTIAATHGYCLAGACELAMSCDITIAAEGCFFGEPELKFGSVVTAMMMPWLTGPKVSKQMLLTGDDRIPAEKALRIGLVNEVVPAGRHLVRAQEIAHQIAVMDPDAVQMTKQAINYAFDCMGMRQALRANLDVAVQIEALETPERKQFQEIARRQGLKAALNWRDSRFGNGS